MTSVESALTNYGTAAALYEQFTTEPSIPQRYRLQARVKWLNALTAAGNSGAILQASAEITSALFQITDYSLLLDLARQLKNGPREIGRLAQQAFGLGVEKAMLDLASAEHPAVALRILARLARSEVYDFGKSRHTVEVWNGLNSQKRTWLWSTKREFWEYISTVFLAFTRIRDFSAADELVNTYLGDSATPIEGRVILMARKASRKVRTRSFSEAMDIFSEMVKLAPMQQECAEAYYWSALQAKKVGDNFGCVEFAKKNSDGPRASTGIAG